MLDLKLDVFPLRVNVIKGLSIKRKYAKIGYFFSMISFEELTTIIESILHNLYD